MSSCNYSGSARRSTIRQMIGAFYLVSLISWSAIPGQAACDPCATFGSGISWGTVTLNQLQEASGITASRRNPQILWTHNDGDGQNLFALSTNGARLATFDLNQIVSDVEAIAAGPGPEPGINYLYVGDVGGSGSPGDARASVNILRLPEPFVDPAWATNPRSLAADGVERFTLSYPTGQFDAETLMVDPLTSDVFVVTKQPGSARWYRANLNGLASGAAITMEFVSAVAFGVASDGGLSADGAQVVLRREDFAMLWKRCEAESIANALARSGFSIPVIGPPTEPNGEGIALLPDGSGYVTISEGNDPQLYFFPAQCPTVPSFTLLPQDQSVFIGGTAEFRALATGYPPPNYQWSFNTQALADQTNATLTLPGIALGQAGTYTINASNAQGSVSATAALIVRPKPDLRITEVMSSPAPGVAPRADWWELTSFESQPVYLTGWRFNDSGGGLADPHVLPAGVSIAPRESIVFVETLTAAEFRAWWGPTNVPVGVQIQQYAGSGLSFSASGDQLALWEAGVTDANDFVSHVNFGAASAGVSFNYDPVSGTFGSLSQPGVNGSFVAATGADVGSPGRVLAPVASPMLTAHFANEMMRIEFETSVGRDYRLESRSSLTDGVWEPTAAMIHATNNATTYFELQPSGNRRYFRVTVD